MTRQTPTPRPPGGAGSGQARAGAGKVPGKPPGKPPGFLRRLGLLLVAAVLLFEEWLWAPLQRAMRALVGWLGLSRLAGWLATRRPYQALLAFLLPVGLMFPFKLAGLWLIASGRLSAGLLVFLGAKLVGTALLAWLFELTRPALLQLAWFARLYGWTLRVREEARAWWHRQPMRRVMQVWRARLRRWRRAG